MQPACMRSVSFLGKFTSGSRIRASRSDLLKLPNGRNAEVQGALQSLPAGATENEWFHSPDALKLHSALVRTGKNEVFAESAEIEAFSLMLQAPLAIHLPGYTELYPQSAQLGPDNDEYLVGICNGTHYFLAVPRRWITDQQREQKGMLLMHSK